ncbi:MAG: DUF3560 domain-containing protein [Candidatus Kapabacteria bacterium]|nr:DUF3560 domain-containing protein [Candidatus Kapabacteria bacterium]
MPENQITENSDIETIANPKSDPISEYDPLFEGAYYELNANNKVELHLPGKEFYQKLPNEVKSDIKRGFLWSNYSGAWVSRSKGGYVPYSMSKYKIKYQGKEELNSFEEQLEAKIQRAERKADKYSGYSENAKKRAESLQSEFNKLRKDWAWITQPNVNTSSGRAFAKQRDRVVARHEKGYAEINKAEYFKEKARKLNISATQKELSSLSYLENRLKENFKIMKNAKEFEQWYDDLIESGEPIDDETLMRIDGRMNHIQLASEKYEFYSKHYYDLIQQKVADDTYFDVATAKKKFKSLLKRYLATKYGIELESCSIAYSCKNGVYYDIKANKDLPDFFTKHSNYNSKDFATVHLERTYKHITESDK